MQVDQQAEKNPFSFFGTSTTYLHRVIPLIIGCNYPAYQTFSIKTDYSVLRRLTAVKDHTRAMIQKMPLHPSRRVKTKIAIVFWCPRSPAMRGGKK
jgi:hypothetical protein